MDAREIEAMLLRDRQEWDALVAVLEAHPEESLHGPGSPSWTSRDVYTHLARWMELSTAQLEARLAGTPVPIAEGTDDEINARWQREDSGLSLAEARARAQSEYQRRFEAIESVPDDRWDETLDGIAHADGAAHYAAHRSFIVGA